MKYTVFKADLCLCDFSIGCVIHSSMTVQHHRQIQIHPPPPASPCPYIQSSKQRVMEKLCLKRFEHYNFPPRHSGTQLVDPKSLLLLLKKKTSSDITTAPNAPTMGAIRRWQRGSGGIQIRPLSAKILKFRISKQTWISSMDTWSQYL